jgi:hypothetical protein
MAADLLETARFYLEFFEFGKNEFDMCVSYVYFLADVFKEAGDEDLAEKLTGALGKLVDWASGQYDGEEGEEAADTLS